MFMIEYRDIGWWYWLLTVVLLTVGIFYSDIGFLLAIGVNIFQLGHYIIRERSVNAFPVQVRFWYLLLLLICFPKVMRWLYWAQFIGTWAQILFGYCAMARLVSLLPWNRNEVITTGLLRKTFFSRPVRGSVKQGFSAMN